MCASANEELGTLADNNPLTSGSTSLKAKAKAPASRNPKSQKSVKVTTANKLKRRGHQSHLRNHQVLSQVNTIGEIRYAQMRDSGSFSLEDSKKRRAHGEFGRMEVGGLRFARLRPQNTS